MIFSILLLSLSRIVRNVFIEYDNVYVEMKCMLNIYHQNMINISTKENKIFTKKHPVFTCSYFLLRCFIVANPTVRHSVSHSVRFFDRVTKRERKRLKPILFSRKSRSLLFTI